MNVVVLGASANPEKYSYKAVEMLKSYGHTAIPVHPSGKTVAGTPTFKYLTSVTDPVDTLTLYVGPKISSSLFSEIASLQPKRIIMNPGAENPELSKFAADQGIAVVEGCTLVMLKTGQF